MNDRFKFRVWDKTGAKSPSLFGFDISPVDDWTKSLMRCGDE